MSPAPDENDRLRQEITDAFKDMLRRDRDAETVSSLAKAMREDLAAIADFARDAKSFLHGLRWLGPILVGALLGDDILATVLRSRAAHDTNSLPHAAGEP